MDERGNALNVPLVHVMRDVNEQQSLIRRETEEHLRELCRQYPERRAKLWNWESSSEAAYLASVEENRQRWIRALGVQDFSRAGPLQAETAPFFEDEKISARHVFVTLSGTFRAHAVYAVAKNARGPRPLLICQHGIGGDETKVAGAARILGFGDENGQYKSFARHAVNAGFAVLAPFLVCTAPVRARMQRICTLLGFTLCGLEIGKLSRLIDWAVTQPEVDAQRIGMWGLSMGGQYTLFTTPVEPRIKAAVCSAFFNQRVNKMVIEDALWSSFLTAPNEDVFIPGFLERFSDAELAALICPRPFRIQCGKGDSISWWPDVQEEFKRAQEPYAALGIGERMSFHLHEGGHEIGLDDGLEFFRRWLPQAR